MSKIFIIAECGHNAMGNMRLSKLMIEEAKKCGADAVKFQAYDTDKIKKPWQSRYFELKFSEYTKEEFQELKEHCDKVGIEFMASAFDIEHLKWLEEMGVKRHKIASRSIRDTELIKAMEKTKKPIIASLGSWNEFGAPNIKNAQFLFCISEYPAYITNDIFPNEFGEEYAGFSDHTQDMYWAREAVKRGATIIEKHFTLDKRLPGHDQKGSADPTELKDFITFVRQHERGIKN
jgi:N-acetylneuraminate synthase/N,N'-diacetyllegionaminate synthase